MAYSQVNRHIAIETPLGDDALLLTSFDGAEYLSRLFHFDLRMYAEDGAIDFETLVGKNTTIRLKLPDGTNRFWNGIMTRFAQGEREGRFTVYQAEMAPWLWFLTQTADSRIFNQKTTPQIVEKIFKDLGFSDFSNRLTGSFVEREYCVQYRETDFNFVSRLLEEEGIFYFFEHENGKHTLVLANDPQAHKPCPGQSTIRYDASSPGRQPEDEISAWQTVKSFRSGSYATTDFNFETPKTNLASSAEGKNPYEIYDSSGEFRERSHGQEIVRVRLQEQVAKSQAMAGSGNSRAFAAGFLFTMTDHYRPDQNQAYVLISVQHHASETGYTQDQKTASDIAYSNHFECLPQSVPFRPSRVTPVPLISSCQTAVVTGPAGEEIYTDEYGRVKVQFHWDREGKRDQDTSCWLRVSHPWAGKGFGAMFLPRVGQEVIVGFLEGDPDQPIIVGRVHNADQKVPYALPAEKTKSTIKTLSSKGGGNFNELRFEDAKGQEQIFLHAAMNFDTRVLGNWLTNVNGEVHRTVDKETFEKCSADKHLQITGDLNEKISGTVSLDAGSDWQAKVGNNLGVEAGMEIHLKAGMNLVVESGTSLTLKVGGNFVNINPAGVFISGTMVMVNSGGAAGTGSGAHPTAPKDPKDSDNATPGGKSQLDPNNHTDKPQRVAAVKFSPAALGLMQSAENGTPFCEVCQRAAEAASSSQASTS